MADRARSMTENLLRQHDVFRGSDADMYVATHSNLARREETRKAAAAQAEVHKASRVREMQEQMKLAAAAQREKEREERAQRRQMAEDTEQEMAEAEKLAAAAAPEPKAPSTPTDRPAAASSDDKEYVDTPPSSPEGETSSYRLRSAHHRCFLRWSWGLKQKALGLFPSLVGALSKRAQARAAAKQQQSAKQDKLKQRFLVRHARDQKVARRPGRA
eukprot:COSAG01_NODE_2432_length_7707_cov_17.497240_6_plen_216_part_00